MLKKKSKKEEDIEQQETSELEDNLDTDELAETDDVDTNAELESLQKTLQESQDKYIRLVAEFDNFRRRTLREKAELIQSAGESLLKDILPFVDDFERGLEQASKTDDMNSVMTGMALIYNKLSDFLTSNGIKEISAINEPFDTDWHEALTEIPTSSDEMKGKVVDVIQKGYTLHDKVIRYAKVVVGK